MAHLPHITLFGVVEATAPTGNWVKVKMDDPGIGANLMAGDGYETFTWREALSCYLQKHSRVDRTTNRLELVWREAPPRARKK